MILFFSRFQRLSLFQFMHYLHYLHISLFIRAHVEYIPSHDTSFNHSLATAWRKLFFRIFPVEVFCNQRLDVDWD